MKTKAQTQVIIATLFDNQTKENLKQEFAFKIFLN